MHSMPLPPHHLAPPLSPSIWLFQVKLKSTAISLCTAPQHPPAAAAAAVPSAPAVGPTALMAVTRGGEGPT